MIDSRSASRARSRAEPRADAGEARAEAPAHRLEFTEVDAVVMDMDGVVTDTASVHAAAWKRLFDDMLRERARERGEPFVPFDARADYRRYVDGKPRLQGVEDFLASRGIRLERGREEDSPTRDTVFGLGERKNGYFREWLAHHGVTVFPGALAFLHALHAAGKPTALFSASRNCARVIRRAGITREFDARVDGEDLSRLGLPGKPDPAMLLEAARRLDVPSSRCAVVEDAIAGVKAGVRGGFRLVIGVAREDRPGEQSRALRKAGAQIVVAALSELFVDRRGLALKTVRGVPHAWDDREAIRRRIVRSEATIFLDYDGTLTPIVEDHREAFLSEGMRRVLQRLAARYRVAVISGRDLADLRARVGLEDLYYAGSHGFDLAGPSGFRERLGEGERFVPALDEAEPALREGLSDIAGHAVERKAFDIAVHYRRVAAARVGDVEAVVDRVLAAHPGLRKNHGKKVFEIRPDVDWDKGKAVRRLLARIAPDRTDATALYVGDDLTDEDAFRELAGSGVTVVVRDGERESERESDRNTSADHALDDVDDVGRFLEYLAGAARRST